MSAALLQVVLLAADDSNTGEDGECLLSRDW